MPIEATYLALTVGLLAGAYMLGMLLWSIIQPQQRVWPPVKVTTGIKVRVWLMTTLIFAAAFMLGLMDWNHFNWPASFRWGIGLPLVIIGNVIVWFGVSKIGMAATSGEATGLKTDGLYRWSRNPQYMADITILFGWGILTASIWAIPVLILGLVVLVVAPLAEEPWLQDQYGAVYQDYRKLVRRYI
ncbi:MAG: methyltransferase [Rhizobiaceae bacterium]